MLRYRYMSTMTARLPLYDRVLQHHFALHRQMARP